MTYLIVEDLEEGYEFKERPTQLWVIVTIEISFLYENQNFLVITQPYYPDPNLKKFDGFWSPPFVGFPVDIGFYPPVTASDLLKRFQNYITEENTRPIVDRLTYGLGLENPILERREGFTELKTSPRTPDTTKAFHIVRYTTRPQGNRALANIADPEGHHDFSFIPLDLQSPFIHSVDGGKVLKFAGRPLYSNLSHLIQTTKIRSQIRSSSFNIDESLFYISENCIIISLDVSGYGRYSHFLSNNIVTPFEKGNQIRDRWMGTIDSLLSTFCLNAGFLWTQFAGDGLVAALPFNEKEHPEVSRAFTSIKSLIKDLSMINSNLSERENIFIRASAHIGKVRFGRISGPITSVPSFSGDDIVRSVRLLEVIRNSNNLQQLNCDTSSLIISPEFKNSVKQLESILSDSWNFIGIVSSKVKEQIFSGDGYIWKN